MPEFSISIDLSELMPANGPLNRTTFPNLAYAVKAIADAAEGQWKAYAAGAALPGGKSIGVRSGQYMRSIMQRQNSDFAWEVYSELPYAQGIEEGVPRRDLKTMLNSSLKVRVSAAGKRYLIIPFRHSHEGNVMRDNAMPENIREWWMHSVPSRVIRIFERESGTGALDIKTGAPLRVPGFRYKWGDRLNRMALESLGANDAQIKRMQGMVMFRKPGGKGGGAHSRYITFRTMVEGSAGWIAPAREGYWPARTTSATLRPVAEEAFTRAMEADVKALLPSTA